MEVKDVKSRLNTDVEYQGSKYKFTSCILRKGNDGNLFYQAEIKDVKANSIIICKLSDIE